MKNQPITAKKVYAVYPKIDKCYRYDNQEERSVPCKPLEDGAGYELSFRIPKTEAKEIIDQLALCWKEFAREKGIKEAPTNYPWKENDADPDHYTFKTKLRGAYSGEPTRKPPVFNSANQPITEPDFQLTTGSTINVNFVPVAYKTAMAQGVSLRLRAVQVLELSSTAGGDSPFDVVDVPPIVPVKKETPAADEFFDDDIPF